MLSAPTRLTAGLDRPSVIVRTPVALFPPILTVPCCTDQAVALSLEISSVPDPLKSRTDITPPLSWSVPLFVVLCRFKRPPEERTAPAAPIEAALDAQNVPGPLLVSDAGEVPSDETASVPTV